MDAVHRGAWVGLRWVTALYALGVVVQFFLVGYGLFAMKHGATIDDAKSLDAHRGFGFVLSDFGTGLILLLTLLAWPKPGSVLGRYLLLVVLAFVQPILATEGYHHWGLGMFHPVNALLLLGLSIHLTIYARRHTRDGAEMGAAAEAAAA